MKFAEHLGAHLTPEWRSQYVEYEEMKKVLYAAQEKAPPGEDVSDEILHRFYTKYEEGFFFFCDKELAKVNTFFAEKLAEAVRKFNDLQLEIANAGVERLQKLTRSFTSLEGPVTGPAAEFKAIAKTKRAAGKRVQRLKELKFLVSEFYLSLVLIQNFQQLNFTAFRKILKKHDKMFRTSTGLEYRKSKVETASFYINKQIDQLIEDTEAIAIHDLEGGDRGKAMRRLRVPPLSEKFSTGSTFFWGLFTGVFLVLLIVLVVSAYFRHKSIQWEPAVRMYRGMLIMFLMFALLGVNVHGWRRGGVNHVLIFELDPRHHLTFVDLLQFAALFGVLWCLSCLAFLFSDFFGIPPFAHPLGLAVFLLLFLLNPTKTFHFRSRMWLMKRLFRIAAAPFYPVQFADFWLADQLNSLVVPLLDFQYLVCFYVYDWHYPHQEMCTNPRNVVRPIIALLPAWWRFLQCVRRFRDSKQAWPHLVNAGKYSTSMFVTLFSTLASVKKSDGEVSTALFWIWVTSLLVGTFYTLYWDIRMDWGLMSKESWKSGENFLLREQIVYDYKAYYYVAMCTDVLLRFMWTLTVSIGNAGFLHHEFFTLFLATVEIFRRFVWNFFRLENEHLNNCGQYRAVRDINIKPIHRETKEELSLEQLMDMEDGPLPKGKIAKNILTASTDSNTPLLSEPSINYRTLGRPYSEPIITVAKL